MRDLCYLLTLKDVGLRERPSDVTTVLVIALYGNVVRSRLV